MVAPGEARIEVREYEHPSTEMCQILTGYFGEGFTLTGLADANLIKYPLLSPTGRLLLLEGSLASRLNSAAPS